MGCKSSTISLKALCRVCRFQDETKNCHPDCGDQCCAVCEMSCIKLASFCSDELLSDHPCALQYFQVRGEFFPKNLYNVFTVSEFCN